MSDIRQSTRTRTFLKATLTFDDPRRLPLECIVRDLSPGGARLSVAPSNILPNQFRLAIPKKDLEVIGVVCWRNGPDVGIAFVIPSDVGEQAPANVLERIRELEAELACLRNRLAGRGNPVETASGPVIVDPAQRLKDGRV
jgi:hypothetical protein